MSSPTWVVEVMCKTFMNKNLESGDMVLRKPQRNENLKIQKVLKT